MHVSLSHRVPGVGPDDAARWWSDFQEGEHDHPFVPTNRRRILARGRGSVTMEDEARVLGLRVFRETVTAFPDAREVRFAGQNDFAKFDGRYRFEPDGDGTRIALEAEIHLRQAIAWADVAAKPLVLGILRVDLAGHAKELRRDMKGKR